MNPANVWSKEELAVIRRYYMSSGPSKCSKLLPNRSRNAIKTKASDMGLANRGSRSWLSVRIDSWTERETDILRKNYGSLGPTECHKLLPSRSVRAISIKASHLGLTEKISTPLVRWTQDEDRILRRNFPSFGPKKCRRLLPHRTSGAISGRVQQLGLTVNGKPWRPKIKPPEVDKRATKKYRVLVYRVYLSGNRHFALVKKSDLRKVGEFRWQLIRAKNTNYAYTKIGQKTVYMHRMIIGENGSKYTDHRNGNGLDNVRKNLRHCTPAQNGWNRGPFNGRRFKGVFRVNDGSISKPWVGHLLVNGKSINLGHFSSELTAAKAVNKAIRKYHGRFAVLNKV